MFRTFSALAIFALTITAAQAGDVTIKYGDLNLSNPHDAHILADRVHTASQSACAELKPGPGAPSLFYQSIYDACVQDAGHAAAEKIGMSQMNGAKLANN